MKAKVINKIFKLCCIVIAVSNLTACGTMINLAQGDFNVYGGVRNDLSVIQAGGVLGVLAIVDLPLSFMLDTLLLPITLSQ